MYVDMHAQTWPRSPGINVATRKSWSCCLSWCSFAECGSKSTLISGGAGGCAQGPVHCRWRYACLCIACGSHVCCRTARASLHLLKRSFGLRCDADPFLGLWACMLFAFLHCVPCMYIYTVYMFIYCWYLFVILLAFLILGVHGLDDGKIYRKALYLMIKTMVSCKFSLKPIHWGSHRKTRFLGISQTRGRHVFASFLVSSRHSHALWQKWQNNMTCPMDPALP